MAKVGSPWRALRPLLLAGAVTATWLTLSASAASADSPRDSGSLPGGLSSSGSSLAAPLTGTVAPLLEAASPAPSPIGLLPPVVGSTSSSADQLIAAVPGVKGRVPAGTVTAVAVPVAAVVDTAADDLIETMAPPLIEAAPVVEPVLKPVTDLVQTTVPSSPVVLPGRLPLEEIAVVREVPAATDAPAAAAAAAAAAAGHITADAATSFPGASGNPLAVTGKPSLQDTAGTEMYSGPAESPWTADPSTPPGPAGPASGAGSGASPSGASGSAAWLDGFGFNLPLPGSFPISGSSRQAPSPVSFDPGSSPD